MYSVLPATEAGLPPIDADPQQAFARSYTDAHRNCSRCPSCPKSPQSGVDLGHIAVASPYACYVERAPEGGYQWDLRSSTATSFTRACARSARASSSVVNERANAGSKPCGSTASSGSCKPGDPDWQLGAEDRAVRGDDSRLARAPLQLGAPCRRRPLRHRDAQQPARRASLRRLLWPHMYGTQYSNQIVTKGQMARGGDFETFQLHPSWDVQAVRGDVRAVRHHRARPRA